MEAEFVGNEIVTFRELDSTNDYCKKLLDSRDVTEGTVIRALRQFRGRGQGNSTWESEGDKNLTFSVILHPLFLEPSRQFCISMAVSLGISDFLAGMAGEISIKWPNDIYAGSRKIAGILIENSIVDNKITDSIAGIGININQASFGSHIPNPVSLQQITGRSYDLKECLDKVCSSIDLYYSILRKGKKEKIKDHYTSRLFMINSEHIYTEKDRTFRAFIRGIDDFGRLALEEEGGRLRYFGMKEVQFIQ